MLSESLGPRIPRTNTLHAESPLSPTEPDRKTLGSAKALEGLGLETSQTAGQSFDNLLPEGRASFFHESWALGSSLLCDYGY